MDKAKELSKNPFKMTNKKEKETEVINKIIEVTTKKVGASELGDALQAEFEKLLLKAKDAVQTWIRASILGELGFTTASELFQAKAKELGYVVENSTADELSPANESANDVYNDIVTKYQLSDVLASQLRTVLDGLDTATDKTEIINAIAAITGDTTDAVSTMLNEQMIVEAVGYLHDTYSSFEEFAAYDETYGISSRLGFDSAQTCWDANPFYYSSTNPADMKIVPTDTTLESFKQQFIYSPQEEVKWNMFDGVEAPEKPKFNAIALRHMISEDPFLKFSYHNLAVGEEAKDLEMIFNTYIKNDDDMIAKLKTFETYTFRILENAIQRDVIATAIVDMLNEFDVAIGEDMKNEGVFTDVVSKISNDINKHIYDVISAYRLYTPELKSELQSVFGSLSLKDIVSKFKNSGITLEDIKNHSMATESAGQSTLIDKLMKAFGVTAAAAGFIVMVLGILLPVLSSVMYLGAMPVTYLFGIGAGILMLSGLGLTFAK